MLITVCIYVLRFSVNMYLFMYVSILHSVKHVKCYSIVCVCVWCVYVCMWSRNVGIEFQSNVPYIR